VLVPLIQPYLRMRAFQGEEFTLDLLFFFSLFWRASRRRLNP